MKILKQKRLWIIILTILLIVLGSLIIIKPFRSDAEKRYDACLTNPPLHMSPAGCVPPGYCIAPNDAQYKCDE